MKSPVIFYHLWPTGEWDRINKSIFTKILNSGLNTKMDKMFICVNSDIEFESINLYGINKSKVEFIRIPDTQSEWPTLQHLYEKYITEEDVPILYAHCKGARFDKNHLSYSAINSWTDGMSYFNIVRWRHALKHLINKRASVGVKVSRMPICHYSGNFWWINSTYLRLLKDPKTQDQGFRNRHGAEFWIGRLGINNLFDMDMKRSDFGYLRVISPSTYEEIDRSTRNICVHKIGNQDISWIVKLNAEYDVYSKETNITTTAVESYVRYIIDNYHNLPKYTYFVQSNSIYPVPNFAQLIKNNYSKFHAFGRLNVRDSNNGSPNHPGLRIKEVWGRIFNSECPEYFDFTSGSMFGASSEEIKKYPIEVYMKILEIVLSGEYTEIDYCFERMWKSFFTGNHIEKISPKKASSEDSLGISFESTEIFTLNNSTGILLDGSSDDMWNILINNASKEYLLFTSGEINNEELVKIEACKYVVDNRIDSQYIEYVFNDWKAIVIKSEIAIKNKNRKKTFIYPFIQTLKDKLL